MSDSEKYVTEGFKILMETLTPYLINELRALYDDQWWTKGVYAIIYDDHKQDYPEFATDEVAKSKLDTLLLLKAYDQNWNTFKKKLPREYKSWVNEVLSFRNKWAHQTEVGLTDSAIARGLETMSYLCLPINASASAELDALVRQVRYGNIQGSTAARPKVIVKVKKPVITAKVPTGLSSWRDVMAPHPDVAEGRYRNAEFAADLSQVITGKASFEYMDPVEFFSRTYITAGMKTLLVEVLKRLSGKDGEPVIELKTAFGGGKTHTMLALYHMLSGKTTTDLVPTLRPIAEAAGLSGLPKVNIAVIVGTAINATKSKRPQDMPGITINTLWGEIAYQLAKTSNNPGLYEIIKEADKKGVNPGSETLTQLFDTCGPCMILIDELVSYVRSLYGIKDLPAGSYENCLSFIQSLTEAVSTSKNCVLIVSIPESDMEVGGEIGQKVLDTITHYIGRKESIWKPVESNEGFEVVRRRLFARATDEEAKKNTCEAFFKMYCDNPADFPVECRQPEYLERMIACYPIHPDVFDKLYNDWATLEKFQRTRGVLRLMANVINSLWENNDTSLLILPSSIPMNVPSVKDELLRYLSDAWNPIVDSEVDGPRSIPKQLENGDIRFGQSLSGRKVARTLFFGSAPSKGMQNRGVDKAEVMLGCVQPGEKLSVYNDTLLMLLKRESYLYSNATSDRFWYDLRPTLRKMMEDKANRIARDTAIDFITQKLQEIPKGSVFKAVHIAPSQSLDIPDDQSTRLVILSPKYSYAPKEQCGIELIDVVNNYLTTRGTGARTYKNTLVFAFIDNGSLDGIISEVKQHLAWKEIDRDKDELELSNADKQNIQSSLKATSENIRTKLNNAYHWCINSRINLSNPSEIILNPEQITVVDNLVSSIEKKLIQDESIITKYAPMRLLMDLDGILWKGKNHLEIKEIWKYYTSYCYLPKLVDYNVLETSIREGLASRNYFAIADGISSGKFINLRWESDFLTFDQSSAILVKKQIVEEELKTSVPETTETPVVETPPVETPQTPGTSTGPFSGSGSINPKSQNANVSSFYLSKKLDNVRLVRDVSKIYEEILQQLESIDDVDYKVSIEVSATFKKNTVPVATKRTIEENCTTLGVDDFGFEE